MMSNSFSDSVKSLMVKIFLVLIALSIFGCKFTGKSLFEIQKDGGVLKCVQEEMEQKTDDAIDDFMTAFMSEI